MNNNRMMIWIVVALVVLLTPLLGMLGMMATGMMSGGGMMSNMMGGGMSGVGMAACGFWFILVAALLVSLLVMLIRSAHGHELSHAQGHRA